MVDVIQIRSFVGILKDPLCDSGVARSMAKIAANHWERMSNFGRFPERNKWLGRESTAAELAYMGNMY